MPPPRRAGEELLEPMVCQGCRATAHQHGNGTVTEIEMRLKGTPAHQPGPGEEVWTNREDSGTKA